MTGFRSFDENSTGERVLNLLEPDYLKLRYVVVKRIVVIKLGVNDSGCNDTRCGGIEVRTDTTKLSNMIKARF